MPFDGAYLHKVVQELEPAVGGKLDKIAQPSRDCIVLGLRGRGGNMRLLISAGSNPKLHLTESSIENPASPPMFCMLLRKHLGGGRLTAVRQPGLERMLCMDFDCYNELGDEVTLTLAIELMGRAGNAVLIGGDGKIIDAVRRIDFADSETRQILPGMTYTPPEPQDKADLTELAAGEAAGLVLGGRDVPLSKGIVERLRGISPTVARELSCRVCGGADSVISELTAEQRAALTAAMAELKAALEPGGGNACAVLGDGDIAPEGAPFDFSFIELTQYPESCRRVEYPGCSALLDSFYRGRDAAEGIRRRRTDLRRTLVNIRERLSRKLAARTQEQEQSEGRDKLRRFGDIISANLWKIQKGDGALCAEDFYEEGSPTVEIPLDRRLTPSGNAQKYYTEYRKQTNAHKLLDGLIADCRSELQYVESVIEALDRATGAAELEAIVAELTAQGVLRRSRAAGKKAAKPAALAPLEYRSDDGFRILCGRNNVMNDQLTHKTARPDDLWLHLQKAPGSHVIVVSEGREIPERTMEQAAVIAACQSSARGTGRAAVDYTPARYVKKPAGAKPGFAVYETYSTAYVIPDEELAQRLKAAAKP